MRAMLQIRAMLHMRSNVTYDGFLLLLFIEDNGIVYFRLLTILVNPLFLTIVTISSAY